MCFVNKLDRMGADFYKARRSRSRSGSPPTSPSSSSPSATESDFKGVVDLVNMNAIVWHDEELGRQVRHRRDPRRPRRPGPRSPTTSSSTPSASHDDVVLEKYLEDENCVTADDLKRAIRNATIHDGLVPVLTGSAFKNKGVQPLLDAVVDYMPSPLDLPPTRRAWTRRARRSSSARPTSTSRSPPSPSRSSPTPTASSPTSGSTRASSRRAARSSTPAPARRSASAASSSCTPTTGRTSTSPGPATSSPASA